MFKIHNQINFNGMRNAFIIKNISTKNSKEFRFVKADTDSSQEDIYGWNYMSNDGIKLLIYEKE